MSQSNTRVETLDLEENALGGEGTRYIADMLRENNVITGLVSFPRFATAAAIFCTLFRNQSTVNIDSILIDNRSYRLAMGYVSASKIFRDP